jgi:hypothetical protein
LTWCDITMPDTVLRRLLDEFSFERMSRRRKPGQEDLKLELPQRHPWKLENTSIKRFMPNLARFPVISWMSSATEMTVRHYSEGLRWHNAHRRDPALLAVQREEHHDIRCDRALKGGFRCPKARED